MLTATWVDMVRKLLSKGTGLMNEPSRCAYVPISTMISPYLMRPVRTYEQACADIAAARERMSVITAFVPVYSTEGLASSRSQIAA